MVGRGNCRGVIVGGNCQGNCPGEMSIPRITLRGENVQTYVKFVRFTNGIPLHLS